MSSERLAKDEEEGEEAVDPWGFYLSSMPWWRLESSQRLLRKQDGLDKKRERKWVAMVDAANGLELFVRKKKTKLKERVRKGVPRQWRRAVWPALLDVEVKPAKGGSVFGASDADDETPKKKGKATVVGFRKHGPKSYQDEASRSLTSYSSLCAQTAGEAPKESIYEVIERDLTRTYPKNKFFETKVVDGGRADRTAETPGITSLRRMLRAYAAFDRDVEYCQGMNYVAALLIIHVCDDQNNEKNDPTPKADGGCVEGSAEEEAFWLFVAALKSPRTSLRELYRPGMVGARRALFVYDKLLKDAAPSIHAHLEREGVIPDMYATHWLVTVFCAQFPFALVARVWDVFLAEGWKPIFKTAIAVLVTYDKDIKSKPFEGLLTFLKNLPDMVDVDKVLAVADSSKVSITTEQIRKHEKEFLKTLDDEHAAAEA